MELSWENIQSVESTRPPMKPGYFEQSRCKSRECRLYSMCLYEHL